MEGSGGSRARAPVYRSLGEFGVQIGDFAPEGAKLGGAGSSAAGAQPAVGWAGSAALAKEGLAGGAGAGAGGGMLSIPAPDIRGEFEDSIEDYSLGRMSSTQATQDSAGAEASVAAAIEAQWAALAEMQAPQFEAAMHAHNCMVAASPKGPSVSLRIFQDGLVREGFTCNLCAGERASFEVEGVHHGFAPPLRVRVGAFSCGEDGSIVAMRRLYGEEEDVYELFDVICAAADSGTFRPICSDDTGAEDVMVFFDAAPGDAGRGRARSSSPGFDEIDWGFSGASSASLSSSLPSDAGMEAAAASAEAVAGSLPSVAEEARAMLDTARRGWPGSPHQASDVRAAALEWLARFAATPEGPGVLCAAGAPEQLTQLLESEPDVLELCHPAFVGLLHIARASDGDATLCDYVERACKATPGLLAELPVSLVSSARRR